VRQLAQRLGGYSGLAMVGTSKTMADEMEQWLFSKGCYGFPMMFPRAGLTILSRTSFPSHSAAAISTRPRKGTTRREHLGPAAPQRIASSRISR
jgi:hypothetical protein